MTGANFVPVLNEKSIPLHEIIPVKKGDMLINLAAMPVAEKGMVNTLRVSEIE